MYVAIDCDSDYNGDPESVDCGVHGVHKALGIDREIFYILRFSLHLKNQIKKIKKVCLFVKAILHFVNKIYYVTLSSIHMFNLHILPAHSKHN